MKAVATSIAFAALCFLPTEGSESVTFDGVWWHTLSTNAKIAAVEGMLAGYDAGWSDATTSVIRCAPCAPLAQRGKTVNALMKSQPPNSAQFGTIIGRIDSIYSEHPELAKASVAWFLRCAASESGDCTDDIASAKQSIH